MNKILIQICKPFWIQQHQCRQNFIMSRLFRNKQKNETETKVEIPKQIIEEQDKQQYDFRSRKKEIDQSKDFAKIRLQNIDVMPDQIGKGGFEQIIFWSQSAETVENIQKIVGALNRVDVAISKISNNYTLNLFKQKVIATSGLNNTYQLLRQYAFFGFKYSIKDQSFWQKIQEKIIRKLPNTHDQISQYIDIAYLMSRLGQGSIIYNDIEKILKFKQLNIEQLVKLQVTYFCAKRGTKQWIYELHNKVLDSINEINTPMLFQLLQVFKETKNLPEGINDAIIRKSQQLFKTFQLKEVSQVCNYYGHSDQHSELWKKLQSHSCILLKHNNVKLEQMVWIVHGIMQSYNFSTEFIKTFIVPNISIHLKNLPILTLSAISKCLYIYELELFTQSIEQQIQQKIIQHFQSIEQIKNQDLIGVIKNYTVTRHASRDLYLFFEQVVIAKHQCIISDRKILEQLIAIYQNSNLCSITLLNNLKNSL